MEITKKKSTAEALMAEYSANLLAIPEAVRYLESRGLAEADVSQGLVGYCPPLSRPRSVLMKGRIVVPIRSVCGEIVAFAGRKLEISDTEDESLSEFCRQSRELAVSSIWQALSHKPKIAVEQQKSWERAKWWNESYPKQHHLYNLHAAKSACRDEGYVVIVEGYFDALILAKLGVRNVVALCGANLSYFHAAKIKRYCDHAICLLDGDSAGATGTERMKPILEEVRIMSHSFVLPDGYDPDDFARRVGAKKLKKAFNHMVEDGIDQIKASL